MKFLKGFLRNFTILLVAYIGYLKWQQEAYLWSILLFISAGILSFLSYWLVQKERRKKSDQ